MYPRRYPLYKKQRQAKMSSEIRPEAAEAFYRALEALQDAEVEVFITLHKCFELRVNAHPNFRPLNFETIPTPDAYIERLDELHREVIDNPQYPSTPQDFAATYTEQSICMRHLMDAIDHWAEAVQKFHNTFEAWAGYSLDKQANLALLHTSPIALDFLSCGSPSPAIALWLSLRLRLMSDRAGNTTSADTPKH